MRTWPPIAASGWSPMTTTYRGYDVWELPPNGQGIAALQMLNILEGYDFSKIPFGSCAPRPPLRRSQEAGLRGPRQVLRRSRIRQGAGEMAAIQGIRRPGAGPSVSDTRAARRLEAGHPPLKEGDTIYLTVADREGNMVSLIQSNYRGMGSGHAPRVIWASASRTGARCSRWKQARPTPTPQASAPSTLIIPAFHHQGWRALPQLWRHGRRLPAHGPRADRDEHD